MSLLVLSQLCGAWPTTLFHSADGARGAPTDFVCLQTGFTCIGFSIDILRHFECHLSRNALTYSGNLRSYGSFSQNRAAASDWAVLLFGRTDHLYALLDFLSMSGCLIAGAIVVVNAWLL